MHCPNRCALAVMASLGLAGCAGTLFDAAPRPQEVPTPVAVPCAEALPAAPAYSTRAERQAADDGRYVALITLDLMLARGHVDRLRAMLEACIRP